MTPVSSISSAKFEHYLTMTAGISSFSSLRTEIRELKAKVLLNTCRTPQGRCPKEFLLENN